VRLVKWVATVGTELAGLFRDAHPGSQSETVQTDSLVILGGWWSGTCKFEAYCVRIGVLFVVLNGWE